MSFKPHSCGRGGIAGIELVFFKKTYPHQHFADSLFETQQGEHESIFVTRIS